MSSKWNKNDPFWVTGKFFPKIRSHHFFPNIITQTMQIFKKICNRSPFNLIHPPPLKLIPKALGLPQIWGDETMTMSLSIIGWPPSLTFSYFLQNPTSKYQMIRLFNQILTCLLKTYCLQLGTLPVEKFAELPVKHCYSFNFIFDLLSRWNQRCYSF